MKKQKRKLLFRMGRLVRQHFNTHKKDFFFKKQENSFHWRVDRH